MRFAHLLLIYSFYLSVTQRLPAVIVVKLQHLSHITEKHILRMSFQNLLSSCIPFKPHQLRNIVFMKDHRIACGISFCQTADFFTAFQKSVQKTIHCIRPQMGLVCHKKAVKMFFCLFRAARFPALSDRSLPRCCPPLECTSQNFSTRNPIYSTRRPMRQSWSVSTAS